MPGAPVIGKIQRADIRPRLQAAVFHHQQRGRTALGQTAKVADQAFFQRALQAGIDGGFDLPGLRLGVAQALGQQRGMHRRLQPAGNHRFLAGIGHVGGTPDALGLHPRQHLVTRPLCGLWVSVRAQSAGCLRKHRQQRGLGM